LDLNKLDIPSNLLQLSKNLGQFLLSRVGTLLGNAASLFTHFFIMIFVVFYLVRDGEKMIDQARYFSPLRAEQEDRILDGTRLVARSVFVGTFVTAICQGLVGGIGLAIVGIPGLFWGTVMAFSSLIPVVGTSLVSLPAIIYLILFGSWKSAVFLALWCALILGSIDNFLRPFLMQGGSKLSPFYIFLAIIGGVQYFGLIGILYGPLILTFAMIMLYIYEVEYREDLLATDRKYMKTNSESPAD
ncbi:MAG: AI-2E family transporter, partial [Syntrophobacteraceae bacterium]